MFDNRLATLALLLSTLFRVALGVTLTVSKTGGNASSPLLYGIMFEVSMLDSEVPIKHHLYLTQI